MFAEYYILKAYYSIDNTIYPVHSQADGGYDLDIEWTIRDEYGTLIDTAEDTVSVEPLDKQKVTHKFKVDKYGIYRVDIEARDTEKKLYSHSSNLFSLMQKPVLYLNPERWTIIRSGLRELARKGMLSWTIL